ncbi:Glycerophosphocholine acyltransferase 1 [Madurella fahalii]|uniref:Glycerophosphocholine acyltransferase 1 n=1 Tax=Madurella fahalii TaxID=1157608 RepID=A0ABQ0G8L1_9PEZI
MAEPESSSLPIPIPSNNNNTNKWEGASTDSEAVLTPTLSGTPPNDDGSVHEHAVDTPTLGPTNPKSPRLSRNPSFSGSSSYQEDWDTFPPLDRLTVLDILDNFALPQQLEKLQRGLSAQTEKVRKSREALENKGRMARERMVDEWRRRVPPAEEQLERYRKRMRTSVEKLGKRWNDTKSITLREKISFIFGVMNIFVSGYLIGGWPEWFHLWYTLQILYFMPIRFYTYHKRGYHYFLADLCYFVNLLLMLSIWVFPSSKRLFTAVYCLAFGNNAVAIIMWRNSLVFHSFDKVTSLFIHIMPCATLHCIVHLLDPEAQRVRFPAIWTIKTSPPGSATAYANVLSMLAWSTIPYAFWQLSYYFFITVRRREKIAAGRPTSFTWLRKSYSKVWIGKLVLSLPDALQEPAFMLIQYTYAVLTMLPCSLWFYSRWASSLFLMVVFAWSVYNGSTYYIDVFGKRFQKELEAMKAEVAKWQHSPDLVGGGDVHSPPLAPQTRDDAIAAAGAGAGGIGDAITGKTLDDRAGRSSSAAGGGLDNIPLLNDERPAAVIATGADTDGGAMDVARERKVVGGS